MESQLAFNKHISQINQLKLPFLQDLVTLLWQTEVYKAHFEKGSVFSPPLQELESLIEWAKKLTPPNGQKNTNLPLGKYAEELITLFIEFHADYKLLARNIQLIANKKTLGEIDFLFHDLNNNQHIHLEFALKFYLKTKFNGEMVFLGPNVKDRLTKKKEKLVHSQTQLLKKHADLLPKEFAHILFTPKIWMKGVKFFPFALNRNYTHTKAWWLNLEAIELLNQDRISFEYVTEKKDWIFPYFKSSPVDFNRLKNQADHYFQLKKNALMVVRRKGKVIIDRGFIMRENWPN